MDGAGSDSDASSAQRKGKRRAQPQEVSSERTPLLGPSGQQVAGAGVDAFTTPDVDTESHRRRRRHRLLSLLLAVFFSTLVLCALIGLAALALAHSYEARVAAALKDGALDRALVWAGPDRVDVLNATEGRVWVRIDARAGIDAGSAIDAVVGPDEGIVGWFRLPGIQRALGRWAVRQVGKLTVTVDGATLYAGERFLADVTLPTVVLPLTSEAPDDHSWLTPLSLPLEVRITTNGTELADFARESWANGYASGYTAIDRVSVHGGDEDESSWRRKLQAVQSNVMIPTRMKVPDLPGLPSPGRNSPFPEFSDLVTLKSFHISSVNHSILIKASADLINPLPDSLDMRIPSIPFFVALQEPNSTNLTSITVAVGHTKPFYLTHPNITLSLIGTVPPIPLDAGSALSAFVSCFLDGQDAPITVGSPILPSLQIPTVFPGPDPKPRILRDVLIKDMRISLRGESVLASGVVYAHIVLPEGLDVGLDARDIWPDVLIFDGEVPDDDDDDIGFPSETATSTLSMDAHLRFHSRDEEGAKIPKEPLPSPLPPRAFARIRPDDWLPAQSARLPPGDQKGTGAEYEVSAQVVDVPLEVLPGRDPLLRSFIAKVLFGGRAGALAGVKGTAAVAATIDGLPVRGGEEGGHVMELLGLPFSGTVRVGRKST